MIFQARSSPQWGRQRAICTNNKVTYRTYALCGVLCCTVLYCTPMITPLSLLLTFTLSSPLLLFSHNSLLLFLHLIFTLTPPLLFLSFSLSLTHISTLFPPLLLPFLDSHSLLLPLLLFLHHSLLHFIQFHTHSHSLHPLPSHLL